MWSLPEDWSKLRKFLYILITFPMMLFFGAIVYSIQAKIWLPFSITLNQSLLVGAVITICLMLSFKRDPEENNDL